MQFESLAQQLAELDASGAVAVAIKGWRVCAEAHYTWHDDDDAATDA